LKIFWQSLLLRDAEVLWEQVSDPYRRSVEGTAIDQVYIREDPVSLRRKKGFRE
jgi:hypothetical protein